MATGLRPAAPALPSAEIASLSMTWGRRSRMRRIWPAWSRRACSAPTPTSTTMPAARRRAWPSPATSGLGSWSADTTRVMPAAMTASAQGGVLPWCEQGSSVTYSVAPRAASPARRKASTSAWGRPPGWVQPRPTMTPSLTITAPTAGFGQVRPSPRRPSESASAMKRRSALTCARSPRPRPPRVRPAPSRNPWPRGNCDRPRRSAHRRRRRARANAPSRFRRSLPTRPRFRPCFPARARSSTPSGRCARIDRAFAAGDLHRAQQFIAIERHAPAVALDDDQFAQLHPLEGGEAEIAGQADAAAADDGGIFRRPRILHLGIEASATRTTHPLPLVNREPADQSLHLLAHARFRQRILVDAVLRQRIKHFGDHVANQPELGNAEATGGAGRGAEPHPRCHGRLFRIERNAVLVAGDVGAAERGFRHFSGQALFAQVDQHEVGIGTAGDDIEPAGFERFGKRLGVFNNVPRVKFERRVQRLAKGHGLRRDHVHQRSALHAGE